MPVADSYQNPTLPIWLLHGGDHFTLLFSTDLSSLEAKTLAPCTLHHFNGLHPAGPRMANITLSAGAQAATSAPEKHVESYIKPAKGEIDSVVQADPDDKKARPDDWTRWRYEVSLATGKEAGGEGVPRTDKPTTFEQGEPEPSQPWRCSSCYAKRFETMCFGMNVAEAAGCQYCEKPRAKCGWTIWLHFPDLPQAGRPT